MHTESDPYSESPLQENEEVQAPRHGYDTRSGDELV